MKTLRTIIWVLAAIAFVVFAAYNWNRVELKLWQNLVLETPLPAVVLMAFALGFLPMWAVHRSVTWNQARRIRTLENSLKNSALAQRTDAAPSPAVHHPADSPVEKSGKSGGDAADPFAPSDSTGDAGGGE